MIRHRRTSSPSFENEHVIVLKASIVVDKINTIGALLQMSLLSTVFQLVLVCTGEWVSANATNMFSNDRTVFKVR